MSELKLKGYSQEALSQPEAGAPFEKACALVAPETWEIYRKNSVSIWIIGDL